MVKLDTSIFSSLQSGRIMFYKQVMLRFINHSFTIALTLFYFILINACIVSLIN